MAGKIPIPGLEFAGVASAFLKPELLDLPNNPVDLAKDTDWSKALAPLATTVQSDSIVTQYSLVEGYASTHPDVVTQFSYDGPDGQRRSFFENGHLDWDAVAAHDDEFRNAYDAVPGRPFRSYDQRFDNGYRDLIIDPRKLDQPLDPSRGPR